MVNKEKQTSSFDKKKQEVFYFENFVFYVLAIFSYKNRGIVGVGRTYLS